MPRARILVAEETITTGSSDRFHVLFASYGVVTPTRAHNLQVVGTLQALADMGHRVTFTTPRLVERATGGLGTLHLPAVDLVLRRPTGLFRLHLRLTAVGRHCSLFADRSVFALQTVWLVLSRRPDVVITRDLVVAFWLTLMRCVIRTPVLFEVHTLEQVMFAKAADTRFSRIQPHRVSKSDFAGYQGDPSWLGRLYVILIRRIEAHALRRCDYVLTLTRVLADTLASAYGVRCVEVVASGHLPLSAAARTVDKQALRRRLGLPHEMPIAVYAGLSFNGKGLESVLEVASYVHGVVMVVLGGSEQEHRAFKQATADRGLRNVLIRPRVPHDEVAKYLLASDVGLLLYPDDDYLAIFSSPLKLFEYLGAGLPVLATRLPATAEVIRDGYNGRLVCPGDAATMARVLLELFENRNAMNTLRRGAITTAALYTFGQRARRIDSLVRAVTRHRRACNPQPPSDGRVSARTGGLRRDEPDR